MANDPLSSNQQFGQHCGSCYRICREDWTYCPYCGAQGRYGSKIRVIPDEIERLRAALEQILAEAVPMGEDRGNSTIEAFARSALSGEPIDVRKYPSPCRNPNKGGGYCPDCGQVHSSIEWPRAAVETTGEQK